MQAWLFSGFLLEVVYIAAMLSYLQIISSAVEIYSYIVYFSYLFTSTRHYEFTNKSTPSWNKRSVVGAMHQYRRGYGLESCSRLDFFFSCVNTCDGLSFINIPSYFTLETYKSTILSKPSKISDVRTGPIGSFPSVFLKINQQLIPILR